MRRGERGRRGGTGNNAILYTGKTGNNATMYGTETLWYMAREGPVEGLVVVKVNNATIYIQVTQVDGER